LTQYNPDERAQNRARQARHRTKKGLPGKALQARQDQLISLVAQGETISSACALMGISRATPDQWKKRWPEYWGQRINRAMARSSGEFLAKPVPFDAAFRKNMLGYETPRHLQTLMDVINEQERLAQEEGSRDRRVLVLMPPEHAKSTLLENYVTYRISQDPEFRSLFISSTLNQAKKRVGVIQRTLTDRRQYADFIDTYGPFESEVRMDRKPWTANYFTTLHAPAHQRDYTLEALGVGGTIYGNRADVIVFDDIATFKNQTPAEIEKQWEWIWGEVRSRLVKGGLFIVIGTHMREGDIYTVMEEKGFFTDKVIIPAITREPGTLSEDDPGEALWEEWVALKELLKLRESDPRMFELMYQQNPLPSIGAVFTEEMLKACYDSERYIGEIPEGTHVICGIDPGVKQYTAGVVMAVKPNGYRYLVDIWNEKGLTGEGGDFGAGVVEFIAELCKTYGVRTLAVENNSWANLINTSLNLRMKLFNLGVSHHAVPIGPASGIKETEAIRQLSGLFTNGLISIPASPGSLRHPGLVEFQTQLLTWNGEGQHWRKKFDILKAFRMAEYAARHLSNPGVSSIPIGDKDASGFLGADSPGFLERVFVG